MKTIAFFNHKSGVGKTTLVYHLAHMLSRMGYPTLAVDLDPQADLTELFKKELQVKALDSETNIQSWLLYLHINKDS